MKNQETTIARITEYFRRFGRAVTKEELEKYTGEKAITPQTPLERGAKKGIPHPPLAKGAKEEEKIPLNPPLPKGENLELDHWSEIYEKKGRRWGALLRHLPYIRGAALCNSIGLRTANQDSDIDLYIITAPGHIWTARFFATLIYQVLGVRRHGKKVAGRMCLSFFSSTEAMEMEQLALKPKDPALAFWCISLLPLHGKKVFERFRLENKNFIQKEINCVIPYKTTDLKEGSLVQKISEVLFGSWFEKLIKKCWLPKTMRSHETLPDKSGTVISDTMLKFHNKDKRRLFVDI